MKSVKKAIFLLFILAIPLLSCSKTNSNISVEEENKIDEDRIITLLNYIQFTTCKVTNSNNRILAEKEFAEIQDIIKPEILINDEIIEQYQTLLNNLSCLKILREKQKMIQEINDLKRKNAIYESLQGTLLIPSGDAVSMGISLAFTAASAGFNYARTINEIDIQEKQQNFDILEQEQTDLDTLSSSLFTTSARVLKASDNTNQLIIPSEMKDFARITALIETCSEENLKQICKENIPTLKNMETKFNVFAPYWLTMGIANYYNGNITDAEKCLNNVIQISNSNSVLRNNPYIVNASKYLILIKLDSIITDSTELDSLSQEIDKYLRYIKDNTITTESNQDNLNYFLFSNNMILKKYDEAERNLNYLLQRGIEHEYGKLACYYYINKKDTNSLEYKRAVVLNSSLSDYIFGPNLNEFDFIDKKSAKKLMSKVGNDSVYLVTKQKLRGCSYFTDSSSGSSVNSEQINDDLTLYYFPDLSWDNLEKYRLDLYNTDGTGIALNFYKKEKLGDNYDIELLSRGVYKEETWGSKVIKESVATVVGGVLGYFLGGGRNGDNSRESAVIGGVAGASVATSIKLFTNDKDLVVETVGVYTDSETYSKIDFDSKSWSKE